MIGAIPGNDVVGLSFANPAGFFALALAIPVLVLHVLRPRRPQSTVASVLLWRAVDAPVSAARPWQRLRWSLLLALQLAAVTLLAFGLARPVRATKAPLAAHTVFVVDASGSMAAKDGKPDRLESARRAVRKLRAQLPAGGVASIVIASPEPQVLLSSSGDQDAFDAALRRIAVVAGPARWQDTFNLAASLETPGKPIGIVLVSDGGLDRTEQRIIPAGTTYVRVGERSTNRAITLFTVEPSGGGLRAHATVRSTGGPRARQVLRIDVDGRTRERLTLDIAAGKTVDRTVTLPAGDRIEAFLEGEDLLTVDDRAVAVGTQARPLRVLVAGAADPFLDNVLATLPGVTVERTTDARPAPGFDLAIYNGVTVPASPGAPYLAIAPSGGAPGITVRGTVAQPSLTVVSDDPLLTELDLSEVAIASAQDLIAPETDSLVGSETTPLLVRGVNQGRSYAYLGFRLDDSNLPLQVAFPLLIDRLVRELAGGAPGTTSVTVGAPLPFDSAEAVAVVRPRGGGVIRVAAGGAAPIADRSGFWEVRQTGRPNRLVAVNPDPRESVLAPVSSLPIALRPAVPGQKAPGGQRSVLPFVIAAILAVLVAEWLVARRRIGVPRRQWRIALVVRALIVALLFGSLAGLTWTRRDRSLAVLFLLDGSDSLGAAGRDAAVDWVRTAIDSQPNGAKAGVVVFGGDARVETLVQRGVGLDTVSVQVDRAHTNAAGALRLAPALLPASARRRVVLVSDGRFTDGDVRAEAQRLAEDGIPVDVHVISAAGVDDVAVTAVDVPSRLEQGDAFVVRAVVRAERATTATVRIRRDDGGGTETVVADRTLELKAGDNVIDVPDRAARPGVARYRVVVDAEGDQREENDTAFSATRVSGPPKVLVVAGAPKTADSLVAALRAAGVESDLVDATGVPSLERLSEYRSTVLVDVEARSLAPDQIRALGAATRELGHGLVVLGGDRSYALGGYGGSALEDLLPVESEVRDPQRRKSVAQVLAIDTSGSMGACHCPAGTNGIANGANRAEGGVNKTDISRTAAARAISAMAADDQVGVLAFNTRHKWIIDLQKVPAEDVVLRGLSGLTARGNTNLATPLLDAGDKLRRAKANLKHIVLFTDGFSSTDGLAGLASQARSLSDEGITVSVVATGEGAADQLGLVARAGRGRFYPGTDLLEIPEIIMQETVIASRTFVVEGEFQPTVTGSASPVRTLSSTPALLGYIATTAKPTAETWLRIGAERDPLLASWQVGLGRVTAWTSDASLRWAQRWASWDGYAGFWAGVVKQTFPGEEGAAVRTEVRGDRLRVQVQGEAAWPDGVTGALRIAAPDGSTRSIPLERTGTDELSAELDAALPGIYAIGAEMLGQDGKRLTTSSGLATRSYAAEYLPGAADVRAMRSVSTATKGRGDIEADAVFDPTGLVAGLARRALATWLLLAACLLWPIDVALRRLTRRRTGAVHLARTTTLESKLRAMRNGVREKVALEPRPDAPRRSGAPASTGGTGASPAPPSPVVARVRARSATAVVAPPARETPGRPAGSRVAAAPVRPPTAPARAGRSPATLDRLLAAKRTREAGATGDADEDSSTTP